MTSYVEIEQNGHVATLTINRPDKLNALSDEVIADLGNAVAQLKSDVRAAVLTGAGKAFVAGADIAAMSGFSQQEAQRFSAKGHAVFASIEALTFPVIAAVNGFALGGGLELALACDFIFASSKARMGQPEVGLGVVPGFGGTQRLPRRVGVGVARELIYSGAMIDAQEALRIGLANRVCEPEQLLPQSLAVADKIAGNGPIAVAAAKRVIGVGMDLPLAQANAVEIETFGQCFESADQKEGMAAFMEKRSPDF